MANDELASLVARMGHLESSNRAFRVLLAGMTCGLCLMFTGWSSRAPEVVQAGRFELVDQEGRVCGHWSCRDGHPGIYLNDATGTERVALWTDPDTTALFLKDDSGTTRVGTALFDHGGGFALHGEQSKGAAVMTLMNQQPRIAFYDDAGKVTEQIPAK